MQKYNSKFILEVKPKDFEEKMKELRRDLKRSSDENQISELAEISIDLQSYLLRWNLQNQKLLKDQQVSDSIITEEIMKNYFLLGELGRHELIAEIKTEAANIRESVMYNLSRKKDEGAINNRWSNNDGAGLKHAMRRGAIAVTTNPQIINEIRKRFPKYWNNKKEQIKKKYNGLSLEQLVAKVTTEVVLESARLLRLVYDLNDVHLGYVSLQLNPYLSGNSEAMLKDAELIYNWLKEEFNEKDPNVVFKIPGTFAGLEVAKELVLKGIGVNITVNYTVAQQLVFGEILEKSRARHCYLTQMNLRLEDPIAIELGEEKCDSPEKISSWSSVAVTRRAYQILYQERMYKNSVLLGASISKPWHVERAIVPGESYPLHMTISPNAVNYFDSVINLISPCISEKIDKKIMEKLLQSETFRKAYEPDGLSPEDFDTYQPTLRTLDGFRKNYDEFLQWCKE